MLLRHSSSWRLDSHFHFLAERRHCASEPAPTHRSELITRTSLLARGGENLIKPIDGQIDVTQADDLASPVFR